MISKEIEWKKNFPHKSARDEQKIAIDFILDELYEKDKRFCIVECGTGGGKSAMGVTVNRYFHDMNNDFSSWFVTTQKILQSQYERDFKPTGEMMSVKSSVNYACSFHKKNTCAQSQQLLRTSDKSSSFFKACTFGCVYKEEKRKFLESFESVTNFPYLLTEANYNGKITKRNLLIIDECHNVESELTKFIEVVISERFAKSVLKLSFPHKMTQFQAVKWIRDVYYPKAASQLAHVELTLEKFGDNFKEKLKEFTSVVRQHDLLRGHVTKTKKFLKIYNKDNWIFELTPAKNRAMRKFSFKPVDVSPYSEEYLFRLGEKVLLMSATVLDKSAFCKSLGINENDASFISIPSPFAIENRPIYTFGIGKMSMKHIDQTLPKMAEAVKSVLDEHKEEKGVIHCHSFKIANYLKENIDDTRLLVHTSDNRDKILESHVRSKKSTVLLSPSMTEGVDLKDDISRFQIIVKIPYPYYGSPLIRKKMNKHKWWYGYATAKTIVQSVGRSIRNSNDHAVTYILDSDWEWFYKKNQKYFPNDFQRCLKI